jgi:hypothetical protein
LSLPTCFAALARLRLAPPHDGRIINSWNFPEGRFMKCVATHLYDRRLRSNALLSAFEKLVPHWKEYFGKAISDGAYVPLG